MTNAEKYLKEDVVVRNLIKEFADFCSRQMNGNASSVRLEQFLSRIAAPTLTEDERAYLRMIDKTYSYITRNREGQLQVITEKLEGKLNWRFDCRINHTLFQFIKERRRILNRGTFERRILMELEKAKKILRDMKWALNAEGKEAIDTVLDELDEQLENS